jgi:hypothetical protein
MGGVCHPKLTAVGKRWDTRVVIGTASDVGIGNRAQQITDKTIELNVGNKMCSRAGYWR